MVDGLTWLANLGGDVWRFVLTIVGIGLVALFNVRARKEQRPYGTAPAEPPPRLADPAHGDEPQQPPIGRIAERLNAFRERAERLRRDYETRPAGESATMFRELAQELDTYLRENGLHQYLPGIESAMEIGFVPGSPYDWMAVDEHGVYEVDSALGHEVRLGRLRDELARILGGLPPPTDYPISMADEARRTAVREEVTEALWQRMTEGPDAPPSGQRQREPTTMEIEERAEWLLAKFHDAIGADHSPHFGIRQARLMARDQLRREATEDEDRE